jgi:catechol 2,3-dioxygenase-like lactoylglutathione lyase family enzyme
MFALHRFTTAEIVSDTEFQPEHLGLPARDPSTLQAWYVRTLGARLVWQSADVPPTFFVQLAGGLILEIYRAKSESGLVSDNGLAGWRHLALRVERLEPARELLASRGVVFTDPIKPAGGGGRVLFFRDAEGNLLHLVEREPGGPLA